MGVWGVLGWVGVWGVLPQSCQNGQTFRPNFFGGFKPVWRFVGTPEWKIWEIFRYFWSNIGHFCQKLMENVIFFKKIRFWENFFRKYEFRAKIKKNQSKFSGLLIRNFGLRPPRPPEPGTVWRNKVQMNNFVHLLCTYSTSTYLWPYFVYRKNCL